MIDRPGNRSNGLIAFKEQHWGLEASKIASCLDCFGNSNFPGAHWSTDYSITRPSGFPNGSFHSHPPIILSSLLCEVARFTIFGKKPGRVKSRVPLKCKVQKEAKSRERCCRATMRLMSKACEFAPISESEKLPYCTGTVAAL
ncbi:hypothetical protein WG66_003442 [Moniliophthora roreri]|nr:hypothetical protein WG66_003442 [Moniliophthora roreri]